MTSGTWFQEKTITLSLRTYIDEFMSPTIIIATITAYFVLLFLVSYISGRKADNAGFFVGNRKSPWYIVAIATIGAPISGVTFVSVPGMVQEKGFSYMQMVLGFFVGQLIIAFILVPLFYRMNLVSVYQYLEDRFGLRSYKTGAWFFFISKMLGAAVRLFLVCLTLQLLVFDPLGLPFLLNVILAVAMVWLYTFRGGVKSIVWTDVLKTVCLILSVILSIFFISKEMNLSLGQMVQNISDSDMSRIFFFDDVNDKRYFFKQFLAGIFTLIATTGLDQDMMQRNLSCRNSRESQKNAFAGSAGIAETGDKLFPAVATSHYLPAVVGVLFIVGLFASAYSAAGSALTALTTSFTIDILGADKKGHDDNKIASIRKRVHVGMAVLMAVVIYVFGLLNNSSVIDAVYILASYTYGPILGLFTFGIIMKWKVRDRFVPLAAIAAPVLCYILQTHSEQWFNGYKFSYELLIFNAAFTFIGLMLLRKSSR